MGYFRLFFFIHEATGHWSCEVLLLIGLTLRSCPLLFSSGVLLCQPQTLTILRHLPALLEGRTLGERLEPLVNVRELV